MRRSLIAWRKRRQKRRLRASVGHQRAAHVLVTLVIMLPIKLATGDPIKAGKPA